MRFVGIDVAAERHVVAVVDESDRVLIKATPFTEDADGYAKLLGVLGAPPDALAAMEATGHYWKNLFAAPVAAGFAVALLNPMRTRRFAGEDLQRTQTDAIDAMGIARFAAQKRPPASRLPVMESRCERVRQAPAERRGRERPADGGPIQVQGLRVANGGCPPGLV